MKKMLGVLLMLGFLLYPICAAALYVDTGWLNLRYTGPTQYMYFPSESGNYYADYDASYSLLGQTYDDEIFCVEDAAGSTSHNNEDYAFYTIDDSLTNYGLDSAKYVKATWVANWFYQGVQSDFRKAVAQVAIWEIVLEDDDTSTLYSLSDGNLQASGGYAGYAQSLLNGKFTEAVNSVEWDNYAGAGNWLLAVSPVPNGDIVEGIAFQNYLVPYNPVSEPATMLLFGTGLIGMAMIGRKKFRNNV